MIDYARVAETLKAWRAEYEHDGPAPAIYDPVVIKRTEALAAAAIESIRDEVLNADANVLDNDQVNYVLGIIDAHLPPPTAEGERG